MLEKVPGGGSKNLMQNLKINYNFLLLSISIAAIFSYFFGYYIDENSAGGGRGDFGNTWKNLQAFENVSLFEAIKLTATQDSNVFQSSRVPGVYIFHKLFNPFTNNPDEFRLSVFLFSISIPITFYFALKLKFKNINPIFILSVTTLIFLSPYYRTSGIWGNEENFGLLTLILSFIFLHLFNYERNQTKKILFLTFLGFFSSLCIYFDQKLVFIPAMCFLIVLFSSNKISYKIYLTVLYFLFSIPVLYLFYIWGGILPTADGNTRDILKGSYYFHHLLYSTTIIGFYIFPLIILIKDIGNKLKSNIFKKEYFLFNISVFIFIFYIIFFYQIQNEIILGKGVFYKLSILLFNEYILQKIFLSIVFLFASIIIFKFIKGDYKNIFVILFLIFGSIIYWPILQEYFDPLILILFFTFLKSEIIFEKRKLFLINIFFVCFLIFSSMYYSKIIGV